MSSSTSALPTFQLSFIIIIFFNFHIYKTEPDNLILTAHEKVVCYEKTSEEIMSCLHPNHAIRWVKDSPVTCGGDHGNVYYYKTIATQDACRAKCEKTYRCAAIEWINKTGILLCSTMTKIRGCKTNLTHGYDRWFIGCCQKLEIKDVGEDSDNVGKLDTCVRQQSKPLKTVYIGEISFSERNIQCLPWTELSDYLESAPYPFTKMQHNYCRNINEDPKGPWCLISGSTLYEYCAIPECDESQKYVEKDQICKLEFTGSCTGEYKLRWIYESNTRICTQTNRNDITRTVDYIAQCRDKCLENNCTSVTVMKESHNSPRKYCLLGNTPIKQCQESSTQTINLLWRGCCKTLKLGIPVAKENFVNCRTITHHFKVNDYVGILDKSIHGHSCLNWAEIVPNIRNGYFPNLENNHSYCRNINNDKNGPWCFLTGKYGFQYCPVHDCDQTVEEQTTEELKTEKPKIEEPTTEKQKIEKPTTEKPKTEKPTTEKPKTKEQTTEEPKIVTVIDDLFCYYDWDIGLQRKCNKEDDYEIKWVIDKTINCILKYDPFEYQTKMTEDLCIDACEKHFFCTTTIYKSNGDCVLYDSFIDCAYKSLSHSETVNRYYKGCCKKMLISKKDNLTNQNLNFRVQCITDKPNDKTNKYIYVGQNSLNNRCLSWKETLPQLEANVFPDQHNDHNYCRNLNLDKKGPWCITSGKTTIEFCSEIRRCSSFTIDDVKSNDICYQFASPLRQTRCHDIDYKLKFVIDHNVECNGNYSVNVHQVYGIVDCKEFCLANKNCVSAIYEENVELFDGKPNHLCKITSQFQICQKNSNSKQKHLWIGCCRQLKLPNSAELKSIKKIEKRPCLFAFPQDRLLSIYIGKANVTVTGKTCRNWLKVERNDLAPSNFPDENDDHNYCRNPNNDEIGPWCFTAGKFTYEYCKVPFCTGKNMDKCPIPFWFTCIILIPWFIAIIVLSLMLYLFYREQLNMPSDVNQGFISDSSEE